VQVDIGMSALGPQQGGGFLDEAGQVDDFIPHFECFAEIEKTLEVILH